MNAEVKVIAKANDRPMMIRFPPGVLEKLDKAAQEQGRSRNSEIVKRLVDSLAADQAKEEKAA